MWDERSAPGEREKLDQFLEEMIGSDRTCEVTVMATTPSERQKFIKIQGQVVRGTHGKAREVIGIAEDVSDEVMTRRELENQKSLASHQARLASIGELAAGVGHEINNPLTIIRGFIEIIRGQMASPEIRLDEVSELVEKIDDSADRIEKIVSGLRSLSHDDISGSDNFAPDSILRDTVGFVDEIYRRQGVSLEMISDVPTSVRLRGHEGKLQQALMNLLSNARDATEGQDDRKIVANFSVSNSELIIKIQDNGSGIAEPIRERIFQPFFTTKEIGKGTGIGLSLVHSIVQEFRGRVECLESPFGGAEFRVSLPIEAEEPVDLDPVKSSGLLEQKFSGKVLIVDDEEGVREFLLLLLSQLGVTVEAVSNGKQALDKIFLEGEVYDAVITDLTMPEMGGLEFVHKMQEEAEGQDQFHQPKVLLATGVPNFHFEEASYPAVVGILNKPFSLQTLKENLTRLL